MSQPHDDDYEDYERDGFEDDECPFLTDCAEQGRKSCRGCWREDEANQDNRLRQR